MRTVAAGCSDVGRKRQNNEDALLVDDGLGLYVVADGIGGQSGGEVASRIAVDSLRTALRGPGLEEAPAALVRGYRFANAEIIGAAAENRELLGMGTTMTSLLVREIAVHVAHIGDSRAYLLRTGRLGQLTFDHGLVAEQVRAGVMTAEQAKRSPYRHIITRALGIEVGVEVDVRSLEGRPGDVFLLCTDGLTEMVDDESIAGILQRATPEEACRELVATANRNGGVDNITVVVVHLRD